MAFSDDDDDDADDHDIEQVNLESQEGQHALAIARSVDEEEEEEDDVDDDEEEEEEEEEDTAGAGGAVADSNAQQQQDTAAGGEMQPTFNFTALLLARNCPRDVKKPFRSNVPCEMSAGFLKNATPSDPK